MILHSSRDVSQLLHSYLVPISMEAHLPKELHHRRRRRHPNQFILCPKNRNPTRNCHRIIAP